MSVCDIVFVSRGPTGVRRLCRWPSGEGFGVNTHAVGAKGVAGMTGGGEETRLLMKEELADDTEGREAGR